MTGARFDERFLDEVRARTSLVSLIGRDVKLTRRGRDHWACCPFHKEKTASFSVSEDKGFAHCFGCGWHGDAIAYVMDRTGCDFPAAVEELAVQAGLQPDREGRTKPKAKPIARQSTEARAQSDAEKLRRALDIWRESQAIEGTLAEAYLRARRINLDAVPGWPLVTLRFHPGLEYWTPPARDGERWQSLGVFPAMIAYVQRADRSFGGVHRTWLRRDGTGKAQVPKAKKMLGDVFGGYLRLCPAARKMAVAEGIETSLSVMAATGMPVWAALSEGNLDAPLPPVCRSVVICADNDTKDKATTEARLGKASRAHASRGCRVSVARPPEGMDFNDMLAEVSA